MQCSDKKKGKFGKAQLVFLHNGQFAGKKMLGKFHNLDGLDVSMTRHVS